MNNFTLVVPPESSCGCGSGRAFGDCHLRNGNLSLASSNIAPAGRRTYHGEPKCLFKPMHNCVNKISLDHIISESVLRQLTDDKIKVTSPTRSFIASVWSDSLQTKYLCKRHNSALSPIDSEASRLLSAFHSAEIDFSQKNASPQRLYFFSGFDIERWMLKTMCATYFAGFTDIRRDTFSLPPNIVKMFYDSAWLEKWGLYVPVEDVAGGPMKGTISGEAAVNLFALGGEVAGVSIKLSGLSFTLIVSGTPAQVAEYSAQSVYRPKYLNFFEGQEVITIALLWEVQDERAIWFSRGDPNAPVPIGYV